MPPASTTGRETPTDMTALPERDAERAFAGTTVEPTLMARWRELTVNAQLGDQDATLGRVTEELTPGALRDVPEGVVELGDPIARGGMGEVRRGTHALPRLHAHGGAGTGVRLRPTRVCPRRPEGSRRHQARTSV